MKAPLQKMWRALSSIPAEGIVAVAVTLAVLLAATSFVLGGPRSRVVKQPLSFSHAAHAAVEVECEVCHTGASTRVRAGRPSREVCIECHDPEDDPLGQSQAEQQLRGLLAAGGEIAWKRLYAVTRDIRFSHAVHVGKGEIPCTTCHGEMGTSTAPPEEVEHIFPMDMCLSCHTEQGATEDCLACHR